MAPKKLFASIRQRERKAMAVNAAGGLAYRRTPRQALAQLASTGCFGDTFYTSACGQLTHALSLADQLDPEFVAKTAIYARRRALMKDMPALLCASLAARRAPFAAEAFAGAIDNVKQLRNFVQIMRSGATGRRSLGTAPRRLVREWLASRSDEQLFLGSIGSNPSLGDVIRMVHPKPSTPSREALYAYLVGQPYDFASLPALVQQYEKFKRNTNVGKVQLPDVPLQMLTALPLTIQDWRQAARRASWQTTRMNLSAFARHGVFDDAECAAVVANRLRCKKLIEGARAFPYQLLVAYMHADERIPQVVRDALHDAMEIATSSAPHVPGQVYVCPDVSGSMHSPVTGRHAASSRVRCLDVAALIAATVLRKNPGAEVIPFKEEVVRVRLDPRDTIMTNAQRIAEVTPGGTDCSAPLRLLNARAATGDLVVIVSDNESWINSRPGFWMEPMETSVMHQWKAFKTRNPQARLVCIDLQPNLTTQVKVRSDVVNVGGFSDHVFQLLADVAAGRHNVDFWVEEIEQISL
ncbi:MAG: TROVE domain-containing protein [Planctomycetales bacterium]|nr:TROVE domain-containing protein [Planctomycetales bacterium]